ncbi:hypothetical protein [Cellulomonas sp. PhB143]|uniref:hypothetical protein n=1 Tax=Cellulomonas sp. PhB143 TaxID=2485186 RepID=UPI000F4A4036|nr:hypothetical protein [Cellulomonas sp. PhB143]ROS76737.1 hypothetical protein EDF32_1558 [Cellulomonas sp. PhB143]
MTRETTSGAGAFRLVLPGTWVSVPLDDPATTRESVKRLVRTQVGRADRLARLRRDAIGQIVGSASDAAAMGAHSYLFSLELLPGVPFPVALLGIDARWPEAAAGLLAEGDLTGALQEAFPDAEVETQTIGPVARVARTVRGEHDGDDHLTLRIEYRIPYPAGDRLLLLRFDAPDLPSAEPFATLFDEITDSLRWTEAGLEPRGAAAPLGLRGGRTERAAGPQTTNGARE